MCHRPPAQSTVAVRSEKELDGRFPAKVLQKNIISKSGRSADRVRLCWQKENLSAIRLRYMGSWPRGKVDPELMIGETASSRPARRTLIKGKHLAGAGIKSWAF